MALKNYTTSIRVEKTIAEIELILSRHGAKKILKEYDGASNVTSVSFIVGTPNGDLPIRLPMNARAVCQVMQNDGALPRRLRGDMDHARRVGWRIIKDWTDSQMAILETQMVKIQEIFLPYAYDMQNQETFYEKLEKKKFQGLLLQNNSEVS